MNKEQFDEGINFFYDLVDMSISPNIILVIYDDSTVEPRIMNASVYQKSYQNTQEDKDMLACYRVEGMLSEEQMENMNTLENKLRIQRGSSKGEFLGEEQFNCPVTRSTLTYGNFQDAEALLKIFIHQATIDGLTSREIQDLLEENENFLAEAENTYHCFLKNNIALEKEQIAVLKKFGIDCPIKKKEKEMKGATADEKNAVPTSTFLTFVYQYSNRLLCKRNRHEETLPDNKQRKFK